MCAGTRKRTSMNLDVPSVKRVTDLLPGGLPIESLWFPLCPRWVLNLFSYDVTWHTYGKSVSQIQVWWHTPLIWATPSAGDLHKDIGRRKIGSSLMACTYLSAVIYFHWRPACTTSLMGLSWEDKAFKFRLHLRAPDLSLNSGKLTGWYLALVSKLSPIKPEPSSSL